MAFPYTVTIPGLVGAVRQLRSAFPAKVGADTLKKWDIAPNNETYVIAVLRFLGVIDDEGKKSNDAARVFVEHDDTAFATQFGELVKTAYSELFESYGEAAWTLSRDQLISFFRAADHTSSTVGTRQANTFLTLAGLAGHGAPPAEAKAPAARRKTSERKAARTAAKPAAGVDPIKKDVKNPAAGTQINTPPSLTVRVEVNLPVTDDQGVYDKIFRSIRENLINGQ